MTPAPKQALALCLHAHQPVGNLPEALEDAHQNHYAPVLQALLEHPNAVVSLAFSGGLLEWMHAHHPKAIDTIAVLRQRQQIEMLGGAMYEPLAALVPSPDFAAQMALASETLERFFGVRPSGAWLPELLWQPRLPEILTNQNLAYTLLNREQLVACGVPAPFASGAGPYTTDHENNAVRVLVFDEAWQGQATQHGAAQALQTLEGQHPQVAVLRLESLQTEWVLDLIQTLGNTTHWTPCTLGEMATQKPKDHIYIAESGWPKLEPFALPATEAQTFLALRDAVPFAAQAWLRAGTWRDFLRKHPEANQMYRRMLMVSKRLAKTRDAATQARLHLYRAQSGVAYWHAKEGGVHQNYLRRAVYQNLILAENLLERPKLHLGYSDFYGNTHDTVVAATPALSVVMDAQRGGTIAELDYHPKAVNLLDTIADAGAATRGAMLDHFIGATEQLANFANNQTLELGDFCDAPFEIGRYRDRINLVRLGTVRGPVGEPVPIEIKKSVRVVRSTARLEIEYRFLNQGNVDIITRFGSAWCFGLLVADAPDRVVRVNGKNVASFGATTEHRNVQTLCLEDAWQGLGIRFDFLGRAALVWQTPIGSTQTSGVSQHQGTRILPLWDLDLPKGGSRRVAFHVAFETLGPADAHTQP